MWRGEIHAPNRHPRDRLFEAMQQKLHWLRQERELLRQNNSELRRNLDNFLTKEGWLTAKFERLRSETADLRQNAISSDGTLRANVQRNTQGSIYHEIIDYLENLLHDKIRLREKLRRERELRAQTEEEASAAAARYQKVTSEMMTELNSLQTRSEELYDEQCASEWRKLQQALDVWTRRTFMDRSAMSRMTVQKLQWASSCPNVTKENTRKALHQIYENCVAFKKKLERQESDYVIKQSTPGILYSREQMNSLNFKEEDGSIVEMSIWPSLYKVSFDNEELLIEREAVWTKKPTQADNTGTGDLYDIEKEIKQEVKAEEDDDELSLIMLGP
ncbi:Hypothetical protein PENO1_047900 [Penicillium occitanis (nom. inval.)]|nr:hypothetical protein PENOC_054580 [Penicillium occitanis (nom. inval.)]PCH00436.1 Hypothetical protein PENO1_047900 [Penicillium occitanis (nom. inval.)]